MIRVRFIFQLILARIYCLYVIRTPDLPFVPCIIHMYASMIGFSRLLVATGWSEIPFGLLGSRAQALPLHKMRFPQHRWRCVFAVVEQKKRHAQQILLAAESVSKICFDRSSVGRILNSRMYRSILYSRFI